jgi:hypothetical protein
MGAGNMVGEESIYVTLTQIINAWRTHLQNHDHAASTVKKYKAAAELLYW